MAISDILFEAREKILGYLERGADYDDADVRRRIAEVILAMDRLRWSEGFDRVPNALLAEASGKPKAEIDRLFPGPVLPQDAMEYLDLLLASRNAPTQEARYAAQAACSASPLPNSNGASATSWNRNEGPATSGVSTSVAAGSRARRA